MAAWEQQVLAATVEIMDNAGKRIGSGGLIDEARVLTAAHVVSAKDRKLPVMSVRFPKGVLHGCIPLVEDRGRGDVAVVNLPEQRPFSLPTPVAVAAPERRLPEHV